MATQEKNQNLALLSMEEALMEFDEELNRLERERKELDQHVVSGRSALGHSFYR